MEKAILDEFESWVKQQGELSLYLAEKSSKDNNVQLEFTFVEDGLSFTLGCSQGNSGNVDFTLRSFAKGLKQWSDAMKTYLDQTKCQVKIAAVLTKAADLYRTKDQLAASASSSGVAAASKSPAVDSDSDFEDTADPDDDALMEDDNDASSDEDDAGCDDSNFTTDFEIKMELRKKLWIQKDREYREKLRKEEEAASQQNQPQVLAAQASSSAAQNSDEFQFNKFYASFPESDSASSFMDYPYSKKHKSDAPVESGASASSSAGKQIFNHDCAAFQIIYNELVMLIKDGENEGFVCDTIDDNLYQWSVKLSKFPEEGNLSSELAHLNEKFGYGYIELQLEFMLDYPFYPPLLRVVRPRFKGSLVQSLANIDLLKLSFWNPAKTVFDVLRQIKNIILCHARIDVESPRNSITEYPEGAHIPLEDFLVKLALAAEVRPRANYELIALANLPKAPQLKAKEKPKEKQAKGAWAAGTGYGSGHLDRHGWNPDAYVKAQNEKDKQIRHVLTHVVTELRKMSIVADDRSAEMFSVVEGSALVPYLEIALNVASFIEIGRHLELYNLIADLLEQFGNIQYFQPLLCPLANQQPSMCLMVQLEKLSKSASLYIDQLERHHILSASKSENVVEMVDLERELAQRIVRLFQNLVGKLTSNGLSFVPAPTAVGTGGRVLRSSASTSASVHVRNETLEHRYKRVLKQHHYGSYVVELGSSTFCHKYHKNASDKIQSEIKAIVKEWTALQSSLPLELASSIFIVVDENHANLMQALITGPEDTPYMNGCFLFDICFPVTYPRVPPMVTLRTTGNGQVRFNPNLYNCGKVCLSLLGTWSGDKGERWNEKTSTLLQVLVSIQSLIMVPEPYFNEPGFESTMGTDQGQKQSAQYTKDIRVHCVHWAMLDILKNPPPAFRDVIQLHFKLKKEQIIQQLDKWLAEDVQSSEFAKHVNAFKAELNSDRMNKLSIA